mmetsp:Transcript_13827/g.52627  ORF Transcript_13827/g.52627 Transcript_13827/m.52627 type:complete len:230 (-) Transcript_13827:851-1540(-)
MPRRCDSAKIMQRRRGKRRYCGCPLPASNPKSSALTRSRECSPERRLTSASDQVSRETAPVETMRMTEINWLPVSVMASRTPGGGAARTLGASRHAGARATAADAAATARRAADTPRRAIEADMGSHLDHPALGHLHRRRQLQHSVPSRPAACARGASEAQGPGAATSPARTCRRFLAEPAGRRGWGWESQRSAGALRAGGRVGGACPQHRTCVATAGLLARCAAVNAH